MPQALPPPCTTSVLEVRFPAPSTSKSFRLVLLRQVEGWQLMFSTRTLAQSLQTLLIFSLHNLRQGLHQSLAGETCNFNILFADTFSLPTGSQVCKTKATLVRKRKPGTQRSVSSKTSFPGYRGAMLAKSIQLGGEIGQYIT